ncbi:MAG TPA: hypothetical protein DIW31_02520 [Bacteroidales bacterium]|nr:hypothetical protein [Bacteroidales bacterium]
MKKIFIYAFIIVLIISVFPRCAKIVAPTGGPKDSLAPVLVRSVPAMNSTNFDGEKITLIFDEFIALKDYQKKLAISPPMVKNPEIIQRGKNIDIKFKEPLKKNTTYTIYFSDAVVDNNEGNPLKNFLFAFSTGSTIDSLTLSGKLRDAFTLLPVENVFVMLYDQNIDSLPIKSLPRYLTRTDKSGLFTFHNLQLKDYKIFALLDNNSNYKFDQATEDIAFIKGMVSKKGLTSPSKNDTTKKVVRTVNLNLFKEENRTQALIGFDRKQRRKITLTFTKNPEGKVKLNPLNFKADSSWYLIERNEKKDSLIYWITNNRISSMDTLKIQLSYLKTDSLKRLQPKLDTVKYIYTDSEEPKRRRKDKDNDTPKKNTLKVDCNVKKDQPIVPYNPMVFTFPEPLRNFNESLIKITNLKDTVDVKGLKLKLDSLSPRIYRIYSNWVPDVKYKLMVLPKAFTSLSGLDNDTLDVNFFGANPEKYGQIILTFLNSPKRVVVELLNEKKDRVFDTRVSRNGEKVTFDYVTPGKYTLRIIEDTNGNGKWDTGWYLKGIQPEKLIYYSDSKTKGVLNIRANWENEISFDFAKQSKP